MRILCRLVVFVGLLMPIAISMADVRISNMNDLNLGSWTGMSDLTTQDDVCVYNDAGPNYLMTAEGSGAGGSFLLQSGANNIAYSVDFKESGGSFTGLTATNSESFTGANQVSDTCGGSTNATVRITASNAALLAAASGSYSGTLYLQVDPN